MIIHFLKSNLIWNWMAIFVFLQLSYFGEYWDFHDFHENNLIQYDWSRFENLKVALHPLSTKHGFWVMSNSSFELDKIEEAFYPTSVMGMVMHCISSESPFFFNACNVFRLHPNAFCCKRFAFSQVTVKNLLNVMPFSKAQSAPENERLKAGLPSNESPICILYFLYHCGRVTSVIIGYISLLK